jgi:hypothetical protein
VLPFPLALLPKNGRLVHLMTQCAQKGPLSHARTHTRTHSLTQMMTRHTHSIPNANTLSHLSRVSPLTCRCAWSMAFSRNSISGENQKPL